MLCGLHELGVRSECLNRCPGQALDEHRLGPAGIFEELLVRFRPDLQKVPHPAAIEVFGARIHVQYARQPRLIAILTLQDRDVGLQIVEQKLRGPFVAIDEQKPVAWRDAVDGLHVGLGPVVGPFRHSPVFDERPSGQ